MTEPPVTPYDQMGGAPFFQTLVHRFYEGVAADPVLRAMYPEDDLGPAEHRLLMFLEQYWGGPTTYSEERGHPRLRMRHAPYVIDESARDRWLDSMRTALDDAMAEHDLDPALEQELWRYLVGAALAMQNAETPEPPRPGMTMHENPR
jgi:hemoglobin